MKQSTVLILQRSYSALDIGFFQFDLISLAISISYGHFVVHSIMFAQLGLNFEYLELVVVDLVGLADELLVFFEQLKVVIVDGNTVIGALHFK